VVARRGAREDFSASLIQITAAFHHFERKNLVGAASLLRASLCKLEKYPAAFGGLDVEAIQLSLRAWLVALNAHKPSPQLPFTVIR